MPMHDLRDLLTTRFGGVIKYGRHEKEHGEGCGLELLSVAKGIPWTDDPQRVGCWDLRPINDVDVSDEVRTRHLIPVLEIYRDSCSWSLERKTLVAERLVLLTIQRIVSELPSLTDETRRQCRDSRDLAEAARVARAVETAAALRVAGSASKAAEVAALAAEWAATLAAEEAGAAAFAAFAAFAAQSAWAAARACAWAAGSAAEAKAELERIFIATCQLWLDAADAGG